MMQSTVIKLLLVIVYLTTVGISQSPQKQRIFICDVSGVHSNRGASVPYSTMATFLPTTFLSPTSTIIFKESFEGGTGFPPAGWKTINADGGGTTGPWFQGNTSILPPQSGIGYVAANYQGANDFYIDEWLISPKIISVSSTDTLTFWHRSPDFSAWSDSIEIRISTTDTARSSFTVELDYFQTSTNGWVQSRYPLNGIIPDGSNIHIAFRYLLYNGGISGMYSDYVGIDEVQIIRSQVEQDMNVASIDYPLSASKVCRGEPFDPLVTFENAGSISQSDIPVRVRIVSPTGLVFEDSATITSLFPGQTTQVEFGSYTPLVGGLYAVQAFCLLGLDQNKSNDSLTTTFTGAVLISGIFTVGSGGNILSLHDAMDTLNHNILTGDVTLSLISSLYTEMPLALGPLDYASVVNAIVIKPATGIAPTINIAATSAQPFGLAIIGVSKVTMDGSNLSQNIRTTTLNMTGVDGKIGVLIRGAVESFADSNVIKNLNIQTGADSMTRSDGYYGILISGYNEAYRDAGNVVTNCGITRHGGVGIAVQWQDGSIIENNFIHDWTQRFGGNDLRGIWIADGAVNSTVRGNVVGNLTTRDNYSWAHGIENSAGENSNARIYNNMIYNILASGAGTGANFSRGIYGSNSANEGDGYYYNSLYLSGTDSSSNPSSYTAGIDIVGGHTITLKNNIVQNQIDLLGTSNENKAYCLYLSALPEEFVSNNNDLYAPIADGVIGYNEGNKETLSDWKNSFSTIQDEASIAVDPLFVAAGNGNLHIQTSATSPVNGKADPVPGILTDVDGMARNANTPDLGVDEFTPGATTIALTYDACWNLISVPMIVEDYQKTSLYPSAASDAFSYESGYIAVPTLMNGIGYWLKFNIPQAVEIAGSPLIVDTIEVYPGWNIIGALTDTVAINSIVQLPEGIVTSKYYGYAGVYLDVAFLIPGRGYWVKVNQSGKLILHNP